MLTEFSAHCYYALPAGPNRFRGSTLKLRAEMAELVDAVDSKSTGATHAGSSPALGTKVIYGYTP